MTTDHERDYGPVMALCQVYNRAIFHLRGERSPARQTEGWQPIETAPQRRKVIVSWVNALGKRRQTFAAYFPEGSLEMSDDCPEEAVNDEGTNVEGGWFECREAGDGMDWYLDEPLTHWRSLPEAPPETAAVDPHAPVPKADA